MLRRSLLAACAGLLLSVAFEPVAVAWVIPVAVAGFVLTTRGLTLRRAFVVGLAFGAAFYFAHIFWMRAVGVSAWLALATLETLFYAALGSASALLQRHRLWPLWFAAAWTTMEVVRSGWPLGGMPWGRLAFAVVDTPIADALPYVGAVGVSFLLALLGALLAWLIGGPVAGLKPAQGGRKAAAVCLVALCGLLAVPVLAPWQAHAEGHLTVAAVQGDVPGNGDDILYDYRQVTQNQVDATVDLARRVDTGEVDRPDLVLWPENSTAVDPFNDGETNSGIWAASSAIQVPILVGAIVDGGENQVLNQGIVWDPETGAGDRYTKWHPVPFGEYIPLRSVFLKYNFFDRLREVGRDMLSGTRREPLDIGGVPVADAICFDIAYDDGLQAQLRNGAELLVVQSSQATFIHTDQIDQQFAITRLRAMETGRWVAVATTNGVSGIIAPDGQVMETADIRTQAVLQQQVGLTDALTPAVRLGPWTGRIAAGLAILGMLLVLLPYRRRQQDAASAAAPEEFEPSEPSEPSPVGGP
ncbi:MAG TPA: apolipoprotein N-acyltransferase [Nocardioides sp.]|uniref:apolipoprotein N-acyltransferase n=1 Tax=uncultured Nocardioides sp. TaxID=198441 RepID=UPI000EEB8F71|nr:apolipoprotein N-acyltransferase [uncultured Nocardioides sp.]HCB06622.1 apolipoprotein N-acyltransferase [Nocardioides sp.]HRD59726.1 apolipoprotein N-acyltransferase [Nocardioides sp.]HRI96391.1 apolipoprotein N-acyltransferase [Nocardioides sp.]HRK44477.1 apolipoprotein N-acyltransferase [Nocardioides sp.]